MTTALLDAPPLTAYDGLDVRGPADGAARQLVDDHGGRSRRDVRVAPAGRGLTSRPTLDELVSGLWREVERGAAVRCPLCDEGTMRARRGGDAHPWHAVCDGCACVLA